MSKERPILFSAPMVRAILEGRKTQTRRIVKPQPPVGHSFAGFTAASTCRADEGKAVWASGGAPALLSDACRIRCPYGQPGDRLWVRETFAIECSVEGRDQPLPHNDGRPVLYAPEADWDGIHPGWTIAHYRAMDPAPDLTCDRASCAQCRDHDMGPHWRPSIHMPRWVSRIDLEVTGVRVERLQDISETDAEAEGVDFLRRVPDADETLTAKQLFECLWSGINGADTWDTNPWVWVVEFQALCKARAAVPS